MKILGIFDSKKQSNIRQHASLDVQFQSDYFTLFSDVNLQKFTDFEKRSHYFAGFFNSKVSITNYMQDSNFNFDLEGCFIHITINNDNSILITNDRMSRIELFYTNSNDVSIFSTSKSLLLELLDSKRDYSQIAIAHILENYGGRPPKTQTIDKNIKRLGHREKILISSTKFNLIQNLSKIEPSNIQMTETELDKYAQILEDAITSRTISGLNIVLFSSGWDSTAILATLVKLVGKSYVKCVIGVMTYSHRSGIANIFEIERAEKITHYFGVELIKVPLSYLENFPEFMEEAVEFMKTNDFAAFTSINHYTMIKAIKQMKFNQAIRIFAGEMSDGLHNFGFAQSALIYHPNSLDFREYWDKMRSYLFGPTFLSFASNQSIETDPVWRIIKLFSVIDIDSIEAGEKQKIKQALIGFFLRNNRIPFTSNSALKSLTPHGIREYESLNYNYYIRPYEKNFQYNSVYSLIITLYHSFHWQSGTVQSLEAAGFALDLEVVNPFCDEKLLEFAEIYPEKYGRGLDLYPTKYPLKKYLKNHLNYPLELNTGIHSYTYDIDPTFSLTRELLCFSGYSDFFKQKLKDLKPAQLMDPKIFKIEVIEDIVADFLESNTYEQKNESILMSLVAFSLIAK